MKTFIYAVICLLFGIGIGWFIGHSQTKHETSEAVGQMVQATESSDATEAARDARAIALIDSGQTESAVRLLCAPLANYYYIYGTNTDQGNRSKVHVLIENLIKSNNTVAKEITNHLAKSGSD